MKPFEMSSSSSRDEFDNCWPYETRYIMNYRNPYGSRHPFYPTMGQPMIYCAQDVCTCDAQPVPRPMRNRSRDQGRGPNCFVKAFRWYTQEHIPASHKCMSRPTATKNNDISGFAAWLDVKYDQFLEESQMGSEMYHVKVRQTFEAERGPGPSKKKRRAKSNEGITQQRSNHSCHYIMKPKENMSRPPSVSCHTSCATTAGSDFANKSICKAHSFSNVTLIVKCKDVDDVTPAQGDMGDKYIGDYSGCRSCKGKQKPSASPSRTYSKESISAKRVEKKTTADKTVSCHEACCQCDQGVDKSHAQTQYEVGPTTIKMNSVVSYKTEGPDCSCQAAEKNVTVTSSKVTYEAVRELDENTPCEMDLASCECIAVAQKAVTKTSSRNNSKVYNDVECQCVIQKADAQTQYTAPNDSNSKCACNIKGAARGDETPVPSVPVSSTRVCPCKGRSKEQVGEQQSVKFAQTTAQTSSHSIYIEKKSAHDYPLFLKIVCADKLSRENFK